MKTELYQEQPEQTGGGTKVLTIEERVAEARSRVLNYLRDRKRVLARGCYQTWQVVTGECAACALGTLLLSLGGVLTGSSCVTQRENMQDTLGPLLSYAEASQLEAGFEGRIYTWSKTAADHSSPWYKLGEELALLRV
jgi:hypothetical protein